MRNGRLRVVTEARVTVGRRGLFYSVRCLRWARSPARSVSLLFSSPSLAFCWWRGASLFLVARGRGWLAGWRARTSLTTSHSPLPPLPPGPWGRCAFDPDGTGPVVSGLGWFRECSSARGLGSLPAAGARVHVALPFQWRLLGWMLAGGYLEVTLFDPSLVPWWVAAAANEGGRRIRHPAAGSGPRARDRTCSWFCMQFTHAPAHLGFAAALLAAGCCCSGWTGAGARAAGARRPRD